MTIALKYGHKLKVGVTKLNLFEYKKNRAEENLKIQIALAIRRVKDPRVKESLVNIVKIECTDKLSVVRVYVSTIRGITIAKRAASGLNSATGFIKKELSRNLRMRYMPELIFIATDSIEYGTKISEKLRKIRGISD